MTEHWHVETGLTGYGPDAADRDGFTAFATVRLAADAIRGELMEAADMEHQGAVIYAESSQYREAWHAMCHADELTNLAQNFDNDRANAPLYAQGGQSWDDAVTKLIFDHCPIGFDPMEGHGEAPESGSPFSGYRSGIYAWQCEHNACQACGDCMGPDNECPNCSG